MDVILGWKPRDKVAILEMDRQVLESVRIAIVRAYTELGISHTVLDIGTLAPPRALCEPFSLRHICRTTVRSLQREGFEAHWFKTGFLGSPYMIHISWETALKRASRVRKAARRSHRRHRRRDDSVSSHCTASGSESESTANSPRIWGDQSAYSLDLAALANPSRLVESITFKSASFLQRFFLYANQFCFPMNGI